jgi:hypothetical protein
MDRQVARSAPVFSHLFTPNFAGKRSRRYWAGSARCRRCQCQATPLLCLCVCAVCLNGFTSLFSLHLLPTCCRRRWDGIEPNLRQGCRFPILGNLLQFNLVLKVWAVPNGPARARPVINEIKHGPTRLI